MDRSAQACIGCLLVLLATAAPVQALAGAPRDRSAMLEQVYQLVNSARLQPRHCGGRALPAAAPLQPSRALTRAAQAHARDMVRRHYFDHTGSDGSAPKQRVRREGYEPLLTGENIAYGPESAREVVDGWLASPGHCENIMDARFRDIGLALDVDRHNGAIYWVQDFGQPRR